MNRPILPLLLLVTTAAPACTSVVSSMPTTATVNGDAWYSTRKVFKSKVWYCPAPTSGQATCTEANMIPADDEKEPLPDPQRPGKK